MIEVPLAYFLRNLAASFLMPPLIWVLIVLLALQFIRKRLWLQKGVIVVAMFLIWVTSTTGFANYLVALSDQWMHWPVPLELSSNVTTSVKQPQKTQATIQTTHQTNHQANLPNFPNPPKHPKAIVVLGGGKNKGVLELTNTNSEDLSSYTYYRIRMAVALYRQTHLPILVTGGKIPNRLSEQAEATIMAKVLEMEFGIKATWVEDESLTTQENAKFSAAILKEAGIDQIYLVTHFEHMPRSQAIFKQYDVESIAAPMGYQYYNQFALKDMTPLDFLPSGDGFTRVRSIWHECIGYLWYQLKFIAR